MLNVKSNSLRLFVEEIQYRNRNPRDLQVLNLLDDLSTNTEILVQKNCNLYRARIINHADIQTKINQEPNFFGYGCRESFVPPSELTRDFRANYRYIPYLYCANHPYIALVEVRPRRGAMVSIATITATDSIRLLDFTLQKKPRNMSMEKQLLFEDLSNLYSTPATKDDDILDYIPTQFIAEYAKSLGYDGIAFSSSLTPEYTPEMHRYNIVIFNYEKCKPVKSNVFEVFETYFTVKNKDSDAERISVECYLEEILPHI
ncbi:MAG: RES family NAD+ phosphorylase [Clostridia bacterium]|nr:RES family NAD+ phosphorylase [Clostridia bacterium]